MNVTVLATCVALLALVTVGCGDEEDVPEGGELEAGAQELVDDTRALQRDLQETAEELAENPEARSDEARERLDELQTEAEQLAERARDELPEDDALRETLVQANERAAELARDLRRRAARDGQTLEELRDRLEEDLDQLPAVPRG